MVDYKRMSTIQILQGMYSILQKTMLDNPGRIANYSGDIGEIAINMSAGALHNE